jgi:hypothetical protein
MLRFPTHEVNARKKDGTYMLRFPTHEVKEETYTTRIAEIDIRIASIYTCVLKNLWQDQIGWSYMHAIQMRRSYSERAAVHE